MGQCESSSYTSKSTENCMTSGKVHEISSTAKFIDKSLIQRLENLSEFKGRVNNTLSTILKDIDKLNTFKDSKDIEDRNLIEKRSYRDRDMAVLRNDNDANTKQIKQIVDMLKEVSTQLDSKVKGIYTHIDEIMKIHTATTRSRVGIALTILAVCATSIGVVYNIYKDNTTQIKEMAIESYKLSN